MAKKWYPVVDILSCIECGTCVNFCSHGVYDKKTVPSSIGHSTLVMIAGTSVGFVQKINSSEKYKTASTLLKILMGTAILLIGLYMFWLAF